VLAADGVARGQPVLDGVVALLDLEQLEVNLFRGVSPPGLPTRVFGGQVASQALVAAGRTVPVEREVHSLHAYFIRAGDPKIPIVYQVERIRDAGWLGARRRAAGRDSGPGVAAGHRAARRGVRHRQRALGEGAEAEPALRHRARLAPRRTGLTDGPIQVWMRADCTLPEDKLLRVCMLTYASDLTLLNSVIARHDIHVPDERIQRASLDHAMWFHRPFRADEWLLYECCSPTASGSRGLAQGRFFSRDGRLVATAVQEGLVRITSHV